MASCENRVAAAGRLKTGWAKPLLQRLLWGLNGLEIGLHEVADRKRGVRSMLGERSDKKAVTCAWLIMPIDHEIWHLATVACERSWLSPSSDKAAST